MIAIGNSGDKELIPRVKECLEDEEPLVRMHAAWALWKLDGKKCEETLMNHRKNEADPEVLDEIDSILEELSASGIADMVQA
jgi:epoxyqueuosine reductase